MRFRACTFLLSCLAAIGCSPFTTLPSIAADRSSTEIERLVTDPALWGEDGLAAIATIGHWQRLGEATVVLYTDKVVSGSKFAKADEAARAGSRLAEEMRRALPALRKREPDALAKAAARATRMKVESLRLIEDDSYRFGLRNEGAVFLKPDVGIASIVARYGKAQKVTTEVVHAQGERRPTVLTIHEYAGGAVKFAESDLAPVAGIVDRVYLDTRAVARELYTAQP